MADPRRDELSDMDKMGIMKSVNVALFYELPPTTDVDRLIDSFHAGVKNATRQLPFMAGSLQYEATGKLAIVTPPESEIQVKTCRLENKSFSAWTEAAFSPNDPAFTALLPEDPAAGNPFGSPVCALQLNFVEGGLTLGFRMNHGAGDWASLDTFLSLVCQGSKAHQEGREMPTYTADLDRTPYSSPAIGPEIAREDLLAKLPLFKVEIKKKVKAQAPPPSKLGIYKIPERAIQEVKAQCQPYLTEVDYISSYDCISALAWTAITRARIQLEPKKATAPTRCVHPIDVRTRDPEHKTSEQYFGNAVIGTLAGPIYAQDLALDGARSLAAAATLVRQSVNLVDLSTIGYMTSLMASLGPMETLASQANFHDMDMFMNTWYSGTVGRYDIGGDAVLRAFRPGLDMPPGACVMILPNSSQGETRVFDVLVSLEILEHEVVRRDKEFLKYFEVVV